MLSHSSDLHYYSYKYTHYIIITKFKLLPHFLTLLLIVLINIAIKQSKYDTTLNIIIWRFSSEICFDGGIWKEILYAYSEEVLDLPSQLCTFLLCTSRNVLYHIDKGSRMRLYSTLRWMFFQDLSVSIYILKAQYHVHNTYF